MCKKNYQNSGQSMNLIRYNVIYVSQTYLEYYSVNKILHHVIVVEYQASLASRRFSYLNLSLVFLLFFLVCFLVARKTLP